MRECQTEAQRGQALHWDTQQGKAVAGSGSRPGLSPQSQVPPLRCPPQELSFSEPVGAHLRPSTWKVPLPQAFPDGFSMQNGVSSIKPTHPPSSGSSRGVGGHRMPEFHPGHLWASVRKRERMGRRDAWDVPILPTGGGTDGREIKIVLTKRGRRSLPSEQ